MSKPAICQTSSIEAAIESEMEDSHRVPLDSEIFMHNLLMAFQCEIANMKKEREEDKEQKARIIAPLSNSAKYIKTYKRK